MTSTAPRWGRVWIGLPGRTGWRRLRMRVLPPGTNDAERRRLAFAEEWPSLGAVGALVALFAVGPEEGAARTLGVVAAVYVVGCAIALRLTRELRGRVRRLDGGEFDLDGDRRELGDTTRIRRIAAEFAALDAALADGSLTPAQHEWAWGAIYSSLEDRVPQRLVPKGLAGPTRFSRGRARRAGAR